MNISLFLKMAEQAVHMQCHKWRNNPRVSREELEDLAERAFMNYSRLAGYGQVIIENLTAGKATPLYDNILTNEFEYSKDMTYSAIYTWWPIGMQHGLADIHKKYVRDEK